ncbi:hypothetical protein UA08_07744 [Talaromyces atroroseus]|uniref:Uncharacterized protein n=1 Tax=Talaromyces atroroseus TaxID=1441469 RepID=A0A225AMU1_TALAT|nr:hypothetical protein UA08_07744 [Talaromyces atroroseus]OKL56909.1 hypothetical protein UA08_07744 [Talaromyces atroroseus]
MVDTPSDSNVLDEPIAIVGMACRYPGEGSSPAGFWNMISNARTAHRTIPKSRFNADAWYHPDPDRKGAMGVKSGFFIDEDPSRFDAPFFSVTAKEASTMDPMHRWILEVTYEALENAGIPMTSLPGSDTGCFVGCFTQDYSLMSNSDIFNTGPYMATGNGATMLSNRVSWFFDLRGPSLSVDTACSSTMYALHLACQSIKAGESKQAIVGGTNLLLYPYLFHSLSKMHMMSPDGQCHSFDDRANGYARGEAIGALVVKSLSSAIADGDTIRAVIRATGCNQDGRTPGITMPSAQAQASLIRSTYAKAGLPLTETAYFEAHGTGTPLGDPLELSALGATFGAAREPDQTPLYVSSVKTNIGHTEGCSALAGIMKAVLSIERGLIAPNAGFENLNPKLRLEEWKLALPPKTIPWPTTGVRRVSVNSFGYGGANGHVILDDAASFFLENGISGNHTTLPLPKAERVTDDGDSGFDSSVISDGEDAGSLSANKLFVFSTFDQAGLVRTGSSWTQFLSGRVQDAKGSALGVDADLITYANDLAYTLSTRRTLFDYRSFAVAPSLTELCSKLEQGLPKIRRAAKNDNVIMVFTGQGAQWPKMGTELIAHPVFLDSIIKTQSVLDSLGCPWNALEELMKPEKDSRINNADLSQPLCSAIQIALVDLLSYWGIKPKAVVGHSSGEIAAAYAARAISHEDAVKVAYLRGIYSTSVGRTLEGVAGAMMAAGISEEEAQHYLDRVTSGKAVVACINSPSSITLSGDKSAIIQLEAMITADNKFARALKVPTAYHSHHMLAIADDYLKAMGQLQMQTPPKDSPFMISSVTAGLIQPGDLDAAYWVKNMVSPVRFAHAVQALIRHSPSTRGRRRAIINYSAMIEVGPHGALKGPLNQILAGIDSKLNTTITYASLLSRGQSAEATALECIGKLWSQGLPVNLLRVNLQEKTFGSPLKVLSDLPAYAWNHSKEFWHEPEMAKANRFKKAPRNDLLGMAVDVQNPHHPRWRQFLSLHEQPWLKDHNITNSVLFPGAGMLIMALEAAHDISDKNKTVHGVEFRDVKFERGMVIPEDPDQSVETSLEFQAHKLDNEVVDGWFRFTLFSLPPDGEWVEHCSGLISIVYSEESEVGGSTESNLEWQEQTEEYKSVCATSTKSIDKAAFYKNMNDIGMGYGALFQNLDNAYAGPNCGYGTVTIPDTKAAMPFQYEYPHLIHPATLDAIFHLLFIGIHSDENMTDAAVPISMGSMFIAADLPKGPGNKYHGYVSGHKTTTREGVGALTISDESWSAPRIIIRDFIARNITSPDASETGEIQRKLFTQIQWMEDVDYFQGPEAESILKASGDPKSQLIAWLQRLCHKSSDLSVFVVGNNGDEGMLEIVRQFAPLPGSRGRFDQCVVIECTEDILSQTKGKLDKDDIVTSFRVADLSKPLSEQDIEPSSFNLVLASRQDESILDNIKSLVKPDGWFIFDAPEGFLDSLGLKHALTLDSDAPKETPIVIASAVTKDKNCQLDEEVVLLEPKAMSPELKALRERLTQGLKKMGARVEYGQLCNVEALHKKKIISLLEVEQPLIISLDEEQLEQFKRLCNSNVYMLWTSRAGLNFSPTTGFLRVIRTEIPQICLPHLEISLQLQTGSKQFADLILDAFTRTVREKSEQLDMEYSERNGQISVPRLIASSSFDSELDINSEKPTAAMSRLQQAGRPLKLTVTVPGRLNTLLWIDDEEAIQPLAEEDVEFQVTNIPLSRVDLDCVLGNTSTTIIGRGATGVVTRVGSKVVNFKPGQQVITLQSNTCRTIVRQKQDLVAAVSISSDLAGAYFPLSMVTAVHAFELGRVQKGEKILIHSAADVMGQTAIQLAQQLEAEIYVTVNSIREKSLLREHYGIREDHIFSAHDTTFSRGIKRMTNGEGVDVVLNTMVGKGFRETWSCLADFGRFIDVSLKARSTLIDVGRQIVYQKINMEQLMDKKRHIVADALKKTYDLVNQRLLGTFHNLTRYSVTDTKKAFGMLQSVDQYANEVLVDFNANALAPMIPFKPASLELDPTATYIVSGGLGGLGPGIVSLMIDHGAKHIVTISRSGAKSEKQRAYLQGWQDRGCRVDALRCDCTDLLQLEALVERSKTEGWRIKGALQLAMVLRDSPFETMSFEKWQTSLRPKVDGTWNLHSLLPKDLDFFITMSSISNIIGNAGQANYCAGNAYQDAICNYRASLGLKGTSINVGLMSDTEEYGTNEEWFGFLERNPQFLPLELKEKDLHCVLEACMKGHTSDGLAIPTNIITGMGDDLERGRDGVTRPTAVWVSDRKFELRQKPTCEKISDSNRSNGSTNTQLNTAAKLAAATTIAEASAAVELAIRHNIASAMTADSEDVDPEKPLHAYGVDSLKAVEVRNWVFREIKTEISVFELLSQMSIAKLAVKMAVNSQLVSKEVAKQGGEISVFE